MPSKLMRAGVPVFSLLLAATLWGLLWYPLRLFEAAAMPGIWVTLIAYASGLAVMAALTKRHWHEMWRDPKLMLALALASGWCNVSFIVAVTEGLVVRVVLLFYLSPVWAVLLSWLWLGEHMTRSSAVVLVLAMTGAMVMLWDPSIGLPLPQTTPDWLAISAGFAFALSNVIVRRLQGMTLPLKTLSNLSGGVLVAGAWISVSAHAVPEVPPPVWLGCVMLGVLGIIIMTLSVQYGVTHMPIYRSAVILLFELVIAAVSAAVLAGEVPGAREWIGGSLIVAASLVSARAHAGGGST